jgi:hypothetical protein
MRETITTDISPGKAGLRKSIASWFYVIALVLLLFSVILIARMWMNANMQNAIPNSSWGIKMGNHGPWRHIYNLRDAFWQILNLQVYSLILAIVSLIIKPKRKTIVFATLALIIFFLFFYTHYWLVD